MQRKNKNQKPVSVVLPTEDQKNQIAQLKQEGAKLLRDESNLINTFISLLISYGTPFSAGAIQWVNYFNNQWDFAHVGNFFFGDKEMTSFTTKTLQWMANQELESIIAKKDLNENPYTPQQLMYMGKYVATYNFFNKGCFGATHDIDGFNEGFTTLLMKAHKIEKACFAKGFQRNTLLALENGSLYFKLNYVEVMYLSKLLTYAAIKGFKFFVLDRYLHSYYEKHQGRLIFSEPTSSTEATNQINKLIEFNKHLAQRNQLVKYSYYTLVFISASLYLHSMLNIRPIEKTNAFILDPNNSGEDFDQLDNFKEKFKEDETIHPFVLYSAYVFLLFMTSNLTRFAKLRYDRFQFNRALEYKKTLLKSMLPSESTSIEKLQGLSMSSSAFTIKISGYQQINSKKVCEKIMDELKKQKITYTELPEIDDADHPGLKVSTLKINANEVPADQKQCAEIQDNLVYALSNESENVHFYNNTHQLSLPIEAQHEEMKPIDDANQYAYTITMTFRSVYKDILNEHNLQLAFPCAKIEFIELPNTKQTKVKITASRKRTDKNHLISGNRNEISKLEESLSKRKKQLGTLKNEFKHKEMQLRSILPSGITIKKAKAKDISNTSSNYLVITLPGKNEQNIVDTILIKLNKNMINYELSEIKDQKNPETSQRFIKINLNDIPSDKELWGKHETKNEVAKPGDGIIRPIVKKSTVANSDSENSDNKPTKQCIELVVPDEWKAKGFVVQDLRHTNNTHFKAFCYFSVNNANFEADIKAAFSTKTKTNNIKKPMTAVASNVNNNAQTPVLNNTTDDGRGTFTEDDQDAPSRSGYDNDSTTETEEPTASESESNTESESNNNSNNKDKDSKDIPASASSFPDVVRTIVFRKERFGCKQVGTKLRMKCPYFRLNFFSINESIKLTEDGEPIPVYLPDPASLRLNYKGK